LPIHTIERHWYRIVADFRESRVHLLNIVSTHSILDSSAQRCHPLEFALHLRMVEDALQLVHAVLAKPARFWVIKGAAQLGTVGVVLAHRSRRRRGHRSRYRLVVLHGYDVRGCRVEVERIRGQELHGTGELEIR